MKLFFLLIAGSKSCRSDTLYTACFYLSPYDMTLNCPQCGGPVPFKTSTSLYAVCGFCKSTLVRTDIDLKKLGTSADLPPDISPLQLGTSGQYEGKGFEVVGRLKVHWQEGVWNEWHIWFADGRTGWLAEAMGLFMVNFELPAFNNKGVFRGVPKRGNVQVGTSFTLDGRDYLIQDVKDCEVVASEGELGYAGFTGRKSTNVDLIGLQQRYACIEYVNDEYNFYAGRYIGFDELQLKNLRELDGWKLR